MSHIQTIEDIRSLGTILTVWAHPDDESFLAAGILAAAIGNGQKVVCLTATKGEQGIQDEKRWPSEHLGDIRQAELTKALNIIGIVEHHWLDYQDGRCGEAKESEAVEKIAKYIRSCKPNSILTFGPDGWTGHPDHQAVSGWVSAAVQDTGVSCDVFHVIGTKEYYDKYLKLADEKLNIFFNINKPPLFNDDECAICFYLPEDLCQKKCRALAAMPSQTEVLFKKFDEQFLTKALSQECFAKSLRKNPSGESKLQKIL